MLYALRRVLSAENWHAAFVGSIENLKSDDVNVISLRKACLLLSRVVCRILTLHG